MEVQLAQIATSAGTNTEHLVKDSPRVCKRNFARLLCRSIPTKKSSRVTGLQLDNHLTGSTGKLKVGT
jgi:hypothetical protein